MQSLDEVFSALSHPSRRAIIARLADGRARVTEIAEPFDLSLNAVSKHLKVLEKAGLVHRTRQGRDHLITFEAGPLRGAASWLDMYEQFWTGRLDRLEEFFAGRKKQ